MKCLHLSEIIQIKALSKKMPFHKSVENTRDLNKAFSSEHGFESLRSLASFRRE